MRGRGGGISSHRNKAASEIRDKIAPVIVVLKTRFRQTGQYPSSNHYETVLGALPGSHIMQVISLQSRVSILQISAVVFVQDRSMSTRVEIFLGR